MVSTVNNTKTEYDLQMQASQSGQTSASAQPNSVYDKQQLSNGSEQYDKETLDDKLNKIANKYSNIKQEDVKNLLATVCGYNEEQLKSLDSNSVDKILACLEEALKQCSSNGKVNTKKFALRFKAYNVMVLKTGNTIQEANKHIEEYKDMTLSGLLQKEGYLDKNVNITEVEQSKVEEAIAKFLNDKLSGKDLTKLKPEDIEVQKKYIGRLIANSSDEEKAILNKAFTNIIAKENVCPALDAMISSFVKPEELQKFLHSFKTEDLINMGLANEDVQKFEYLLSANLDEEGLKTHRKDIVNLMAKLGEANKEVFKSIEAKKHKALKQGVKPEFTEEELAVIQKLDFFKSAEAGNISGTANNNVVDKDFKTEFLAQLINDAKENGTYEDVMGLVKEFALNNKELTPQNFEELMNTLTNEEYQSIKTPAEKKQEAAPTADVGFVERKPVDTTKLNTLRQQITSSVPQNTPFRVEKNSTNPIEKDESNALQTKMNEAKSNQDRLEIIKEFFDKSPVLKIVLEKYLTGASDPLTILNALPSNARRYLAHKLVSKGALKEDDIQKLNLSYGEKQLLINTYEETQKGTETV